MDADPTGFDVGEQPDQPDGVERLGQAIGDRLADEHMVGDGDRPGGGVLLAGGQGRPGRGQQVVGLHPLDVDRSPLAPAGTGHHQGAGQVPPPAGRQHRVEEDGLGQHVGRRAARQHLGDLGQREAVLGPEGEHDGVVVRGRLELEVEGDAEPLAEGQAERPVDPTAIGGVHDELGALALVEDPFDDDAFPGGEGPEGGEPGAQVGDHLIGHLLRHARFLPDQGSRPFAVALGQQRFELGPERAHLIGELGGACRCLAQPEGDGRREVAGVVDAHRTRLHLDHAPRVGAQQEDVAGGGLDGEVLVHGSHGDAVGVEHHPVVTRFGDGTATGQRGQPCPAPGPEAAVDGVVMEMRTSPAASGLDPPGHQIDHLVETLPRESGVGRGPPDQVVERSHLPFVGGRDFGDELLGQYVERGHRGLEHVEVPGPDPGEQRGAFDQLIAGERKEPSRRGALELVVGPSHPLEEGADGPGRSDLADQFDGADVDAQLERGGGHQGPEVPGPEALLDDTPAGARQAAVVGGDLERGIDRVGSGPGPVGTPSGAPTGAA